MKKEWFAAKELAGIPGLPSSPQGINLRAKRDDWKKRRRSGVQGKALEYHIDNLPDNILNILRLNENNIQYRVNKKESSSILIEAIERLTESKREKVISFITSFGTEGLIELIDQRQANNPQEKSPLKQED
ncbi:DNA-binding protein [Candidatus Regiella insecticola]|uniref:MuA-transposase/repressor protein CI DNA-binding n=1 Tax=Candidatus Regiella insecticola TaxID=138073 RepID=A0A6L2ZMI9_9ENTR|nr:DNA-binding protein [Candidatus Regiella insecticola]GFN45505.1 muA-transposase/repressor protein CI DNA-binding [Candidatus Regiella insecticola]